MGKKKVTGKNRLDKFYHLAKEQGYRSRASFKLIQLDAKFSLLNASRSILDLCAAPGGWMQVAVQRAPVGALVIGVDLVSISPIRGAISVQEDITKPKCRATIKRLLSENGFKAFDLMLHDGSPNVGGAWAQEATSQNALVIDSVKLATEFLAPKGTFVTKIFRSQDYNAVVYCLRKLFDRVEVYKPVASRLSSAEIYLIGLRYKAPAKIDPRMLDIKYLFDGATDPQKPVSVLDVLPGSKQKRHRDGYEDGTTLVRKIRHASEFVEADNPVEMLGTTTSISFDDPSSIPLKEHPLTTEEVIALCEDLSVLGRQDFKQLIKWRINIRKAISSTAKTTATVETVKENENEDVDKEEEDDDEKILDEMEELTHAVERKKKREKKIIAKRRAKDKARKATGMQIDATEDDYVDNDLFSLGSIKGKDDLATVDETEDAEVSDLDDNDAGADNEADDDVDSSDLDSDEERERYDKQLEKSLDDAYEQYIKEKGGSTKQKKLRKRAYADEFMEDTGDAAEIAEPFVDSDEDQGDQEANPLVVPIDKERVPTQDELTQRWFSDNIFAEAVEEGDLGDDESGDDVHEDVVKHNVPAPLKTDKSLQNQKEVGTLKKSSTEVQKVKAVKDRDLGKDDINVVQADVQEDHDFVPRKSSKSLQNHSGAETRRKRTAKEDEDDLEVVPAPGNSSESSSSDDDSDYDSDTKAEIRAVGKKLLGSKRKRDDMIDMAHHKRMFDDDHGALPHWFLEDERKHNQPPKLVTKEEMAAERARFNEINARPAKKVAEAKLRKQRAAHRTLEKVRKKANTISDQTDINDRSKRRMIDQLYKKATPKKPGKEKVVAKKGVQVRPGKGKVLVDRRMKKDARQHGMKKQAKNDKAKGKGKGKGKGNGNGPGRGSTQGGNKGKR